MSEHTPLTEAERETLRDACNLSQRHELPMNVCAVVERILAARTSTATADTACPTCGRSDDWRGDTAPGAPCLGCGRYPAASAADTLQRERLQRALDAATADTGLRERVEAALKLVSGEMSAAAYLTLTQALATPASTEDRADNEGTWACPAECGHGTGDHTTGLLCRVCWAVCGQVSAGRDARGDQ